MSQKNASKVKPLSSQEMIERFVMRARRVEAHSLVQSGDAKRYSTPTETITISEAGEVGIRYNVPSDEEAIEALAGRLRPFIVKSEPIYLSNIFKAIGLCVPAESLTEGEKKCLGSAKEWFEHRYEKKDSKTYAVQVLDKEGNPQTGYLSDALLAESWVYADVVHADPREEKAEGLKTGYLERYKAASSYFCEFALVIIDLLNLVEELAGENLLQLSDDVWEKPVTYAGAIETESEKVVKGSMYVFPVGTEPLPGVAPKDIPGAVKATPTLMKALSQPEAAAIFSVFNAEGQLTSCEPTFREISDDCFTFLINGIAKLTIPKGILSQQTSQKITITFELMGTKSNDAKELLESITHSNFCELQFMYDNLRREVRIQLPISLDNEEEKPAG